MSKKVRHLLGISGGKDSAALAIYMKDNYPQLDIEYYTTDTGEELQETYDLIDRLEIYLGKKIVRLEYGKDSDNHQLSPFELLHKSKRGYLPNADTRWCTEYLKLKPFEDFINGDPVVSYVGIRGDEDRDGYISRKPGIQSVFPFRKNIWSLDVIDKVLSNVNLDVQLKSFSIYGKDGDDQFREVLEQPISMRFTSKRKLDLLLSLNAKLFNKLTFEYLKTTTYPLSNVEEYPLLEDDTVSIKEDIFALLRNSGVGVPKYYEEINFEVDGQIGKYARSRSGCYFCFFQQKIEWIWLYEQHPELYQKAVDFEKSGYTWNETESLSELIQPERIRQIKLDSIQKQRKAKDAHQENSPLLMYKIHDLNEGEEGCAACFI